jgi:DNA-binding response OmpR family regulator
MEGHPHILLVEDDPNLGYILSEYLGMKDFTVTWVKDGKQALDKTKSHPFALCILDVMLPEMDGFTLAEKITASGNTVPFIFLTAKQLKVDKLKGFTLGADDYITKPVDEEELVARIRAVLKRAAAKPEQVSDEAVRIGKSVFFHRKQLLLHNNEEYKLTSRESDMLQLLIRYKNTLLDRDTALKKIWGSNDYFNRRSMDVLISRLRKHLSADASVHITNIHGRGYMLQEE